MQQTWYFRYHFPLHSLTRGNYVGPVLSRIPSPCLCWGRSRPRPLAVACSGMELWYLFVHDLDSARPPQHGRQFRRMAIQCGQLCSNLVRYL